MDDGGSHGRLAPEAALSEREGRRLQRVSRMAAIDPRAPAEAVGIRLLPPNLGGVRSRSQQPLVEQLPELMRERGLSANRLAGLAGVSQSHLSRALRRADQKTIAGELAARIALALELPEDWFPETRTARLYDRLRRDAALRDRLYDEFVRPPSR